MKAAIIAAALIASTSIAFADDSLPAKAMKDAPGVTGDGKTADPTAKPSSGSLSEKAMQDQPGVNSDKTGTTATPTAKPADGSLSDKAMKDAPGVGK